jgi:hypothetical protein
VSATRPFPEASPSKLNPVIYTYKAKVPSFMTDAVTPLRDAKEHRWLYEALAPNALRSEKQSFYAILAEAATNPGSSGYARRPLDALWSKDWQRWEKERREDVWPGEWAGLDPQQLTIGEQMYRRSLLLRSLPADARKPFLPSAAFGTGTTEPRKRSMLREFESISWSMEDYMESKDREEDEGNKTDPELVMSLAVGDFVLHFADKGNHTGLAALGVDDGTLRMWAAFLVNTVDENLSAVVNAFSSYATAHGDESVFTEMALSTFIVRGYAYNERAGLYDLNGIGKQLLDYAIAHPVPRTLVVARVLEQHLRDRAMWDMIRHHYPDLKGWDDFEKKVRK